MNRIKELRKLNDMTLLELAHKLGVSESTVQRYESGNIRMFNYDTISMLATIFNCRPEYVMGWDDGVPNIPNARPVSRKRFPVLGSVACGEPILMDEQRDVQVDASDDIDADFVLIARGDSMTGARIHDGDVVFIRKQETVDNGQIAVVAIDDEATLKRFYKYDDLIVLRAENPAYPDIEIRPGDGKQVHILGLAIKFQGDVR